MEQHKTTWVDWALIIAAYTFALWCLFFLPARADTFRYEILVRFCQSQDCREHRWPQEREVIPSMCGHAAQQLAIEWLETHPGYHVARFSCGRSSAAI